MGVKPANAESGQSGRCLLTWLLELPSLHPRGPTSAGEMGGWGLPRAQAGQHPAQGQSFGIECSLPFPLLLSSLPDLPEISVSHVNLTVREGDNAVITCNGSGSPLPDVDWIVTGLQSINTHQVGDGASGPNGRLGKPHLLVQRR